MPQIYFKGAIWTNHALSRLSERGLTQDIAAHTFNSPEKTTNGREAGTYQYHRRFDRSLVTVVARQNEKSEWIVLSCWADPPIKGSGDYERKIANRAYHSSSGWRKLWIILKRQLGISKY